MQIPTPNQRESMVAPENRLQNNQPGPIFNSQFNPPPQSVVNENPPAIDQACVSCNLKDNLDKKMLPCGCLIHTNCVQVSYEIPLSEVESKIPMFACQRCKKPIQFEFFDKVNNLKEDAKRNAKLLMFSYCKFRCPKDDKEMSFTTLNKKFKARNKKCTNCDYKYCSFCCAKGGHRFFCDLLKEFKKGKLNEDHFIRR